MTSLQPLTPPTASPLAAPPKVEQPRLAKVAQQFEAIFVRQMLAEARKTHFGGDDVLGGQGMDTFRQMQDEKFADIAAERGSFGLAKMIEAQLAKQVGAQSPLPHSRTGPPLTLPAGGRGIEVPGPSDGST